MKKLGKKIHSSEQTVQAYGACLCNCTSNVDAYQATIDGYQLEFLTNFEGWTGL